MGVTAIFELPVPIWIATEVLGERNATGWGSLEFDVVMPSAGGAVGTPPVIDGVAVPAQKPGSDELLVWEQRFAACTPGAESESTALCSIVVQTHNSREADTDRYELSTVVDPWFDAVRT